MFGAGLGHHYVGHVVVQGHGVGGRDGLEGTGGNLFGLKGWERF